MTRPILPNTLEHDILLVLDEHGPLAAAPVQRLIDAKHRLIEWSTVRDALLRLGGRLLAVQDDRYRWSITDAGREVAHGKPVAELPVTTDLPPVARPRQWQGNGDVRPVVLRPGALDAASLPSRYGNELRWSDGRREAV